MEAAAQPAYVTRHTRARLAAALADDDDGDGGGSSDSDGEAGRSRKRRRDDGGGGGASEDDSDDWEDYDSDESARRRRRERDRRRRAAKRAEREAKREAKRRRRAGAADNAEEEDGGDGAGPSSRQAAPRGHMPHPNTHRPDVCFSWLQRAERARGEYVPQLGDWVVYVAQGHAEYLDACGDTSAQRPWLTIPGFRGAEPCCVTGLEYAVNRDKGNATVARLTLTMADDALGQRGTRCVLCALIVARSYACCAHAGRRATRFEVELPNMTQEGSPDFIVEYVRCMCTRWVGCAHVWAPLF